MTNFYFLWIFQIRIFMFVPLSLICMRETASDIVPLSKVYYASVMPTDRLASQFFLRVAEVNKWTFDQFSTKHVTFQSSIAPSENWVPLLPTSGDHSRVCALFTATKDLRIQVRACAGGGRRPKLWCIYAHSAVKHTRINKKRTSLSYMAILLSSHYSMIAITTMDLHSCMR